MIPPILNYTIKLESKKSAHEFFLNLDTLNLSDHIFSDNDEGLVAYLIQKAPLVIKFKNQRSFFRQTTTKYISTNIVATFHETNRTTIITLKLRTNPTYYLWYLIVTVSILLTIFTSWFDSHIFSLFFILLVIIVIDSYSKHDLLQRVKTILKTTL